MIEIAIASKDRECSFVSNSTQHRLVFHANLSAIVIGYQAIEELDR